MEHTLISQDLAEGYFKNIKIFAFEMACDKIFGGYWRWCCFKVGSELHILECAFTEQGETHWVLGVVK